MAGPGAVTPLRKRPLDAAIALFLVCNVVLILAIETQVFLPRELYFKELTDLVDWHIRTTGDFLVRDKPVYFRSLVLAEICIQFPLCVAFAYAIILGRDHGRTTGLIYGVHTATTMIPILADILAAKVDTKARLLGAYIPFLIIPIFIIVRLLASPTPFRSKRKVQ